MAQKTVCDVCGQEITEEDKKPVELRRVPLVLKADIHLGGKWIPADICAVCLHGAARQHDKSPNPAERPYKGLQWLVWLTGVRTPGPHAGFITEGEAQRYLTTQPSGGEIRPA